MKKPLAAPAAARHWVFAYGTLLEPARQRRLFGRDVPAAPAVLSGWLKSRCVGRYFGIRPRAGAVTRGGLLRLNSAEIKAADAWEMVPELYRRRRVRVRVEASLPQLIKEGRRRPAIVPCWVYVPADAVDAGRRGALPRR
jgi:gamma-glutamylcyclotransferase (GGCT)/AIG2-like uncharacterized protein YtfP